MSSPSNLAKITPGYMGFHILSPENEIREMHPGQIIEYTVKPIGGIPLHWVTEITHVESLKFFVDEQRKGPYSFWHHKHFLTEVPGGVEMTDVVHYSLPLGILGRLINRFIVRRQLASIFDYREKVLHEMFNISATTK